MSRQRTSLLAALVWGSLLVACSDDAGVQAQSAVTLQPTALTPAAAPTTTKSPQTTPVPTTTIAPTSTTVVEAGRSATTVWEAAAPGAIGLDDPYFPTYGNGGYDVESYTIDLTWDPEANSIEATTTIVARATQTLSTLNLDLYKLAVSEVTVDGTPAAHEQTEFELTVDPATDIATGAQFTAAVTYAGEPSPQPGFLVAGSATTNVA
jgi:hypothetical protein